MRRFFLEGTFEQRVNRLVLRLFPIIFLAFVLLAAFQGSLVIVDLFVYALASAVLAGIAGFIITGFIRNRD